MDLDLSANLKTAISTWVAEAFKHLNGNGHSEQLSVLMKCMQGDGDVCVIYSVRHNALIIETMDFAEQTVTEIFREDLVPWPGGLQLPEMDEEQ